MKKAFMGVAFVIFFGTQASEPRAAGPTRDQIAQDAEPRQAHAQNQVVQHQRTRYEIMEMFHCASFMRDFLDDGDQLTTNGRE